MKKSVFIACLSCIVSMSCVCPSFAYTAILSYSFEGVNVELGPLNIEPGGLVIIYGKPGDLPGQLTPSPYDIFDYFEPAVDFVFHYDPTEGTSIVFRPEDEHMLDDPSRIIGLNLLKDTAYGDIDESMMAELNFSEIDEAVHFDYDDTLVLLLASGKTIKIGEFVRKGSYLMAEINIEERSIPETSTFLLLLTGLLGLLGIRKHRKRWKSIMKRIMSHILGGGILALIGMFVAAQPTAAQICNSITEIPKAECEALEAFYNITNGDNWTNNTGWLNTDSPCDWFGVTCNAGYVTKIVLNANQLNGTIPQELGNLVSLQELQLRNNQLAGNIPDALGNVTNLRIFNLNENQLTGALPSNLKSLTNLTDLSFDGTEICEPQDATFQTWLGNVPVLNRTGKACTLADGLIAHYPFDNNAYDESGNGSHGTLLDGVDFVVGAADRAVLFGNSANDRITVSSSVVDGLTDFTVSGFFKIVNDSTGYYHWISGANADEQNAFLLEYRSVTNLWVVTIAGTPYTFEANNLIEDETWHHIALERHGTIARLYIDGQEIGTGIPVSSVSIHVAPEGFMIGQDQDCVGGCFQPGENWKGAIDELRFYNRALAKEEVQRLYAEVDPASFCGNVTEIPQTECEALIHFYNSTDGEHWKDNSHWLQTHTPCSWFGITCDNGQVSRIDLRDNRLLGTISPQIGNLTYAEYINLRDNQLSGNIPVELANLSNLQHLWLKSNQLSGSIPIELGNLSVLRNLYLSNNQLTGTIPSEIGDLSNLRALSIAQNRISGPIPESFGNLNNVRYLFLHKNQLNGTIPSALGNLVNLEQLWLEENQLNNFIPPELGSLTSLQTLRLSDTQLEGALPVALNGMTAIQEFRFAGTNVCLPESTDMQTWLTNIPSVESTNRPCSISDGLVAYYPLDGHANDVSGKENHGVLQGDVSFVSSETGSAALFDGNGDYIAVSDSNSLDVKYLTITMLINARELSDEVFTLNGPNGLVSKDHAYVFRILQSKIDHDFHNGIRWKGWPDGQTRYDTHNLQENVELNRWYFVGMMFDGHITKYFVNGEVVETIEWAVDINNNNEELRIGWQWDNRYWNGLIDEVRIHNRALSEEEIQQVYAAASPSGFCNDVADIPLVECQALIGLYNSTNGEQWNNNSGWLQTKTPCSWNGITCHNGHVTEIFLGDNNLNGELPAAIGTFQQLRILSARKNHLTGSVPPEIGNLPSLERLWLHENELSGPIPGEIGNLSNLQNLNLRSNQLTSIPASIGNLSNLQGLSLHDNQISSIPPQVGNLAQLEGIDLSWNQLGSLPSEFWNLTQLRSLRLHDTGLNEFPKDVVNLTQLQTLTLSYNPFLAGPLLERLTELTDLQTFMFNDTGLCEPQGVNFQVWLAGISNLERTGNACTLADGLVAYYPFNNNGNDESGNSNHGAVNGAVLTTDRFGNPDSAYNFDGINDYIIVADGSQFNFTDSFSLSVWINPKAAQVPHAGILDKSHANVVNDNLQKGFFLQKSVDSNLAFASRYGCGRFDCEYNDTYSMTNSEGVRIFPLPEEWNHILIVAQSYNGTIKSYLNGILVEEYITSDTSATNGALPLLIGAVNGLERPFNGVIDDIRIYNRALTEGEVGKLYAENDSSLFCESVTEIPNNECEGVVDFYNSTYGESWNWNTGWLLTNTPCTWYGVTCSDGHITHLELAENNVEGSLSADLTKLTYLQELDLYGNTLSGEIPPEFGSFSYLRLIHLGNNQLSGPIPAELGDLKQLEGLHLYENYLTGGIPPELGSLSKLRFLGLFANALSGPIPPELGNLRNVKILDLYGNQLSGRLPAEFGNLNNLRELYVNYNPLQGSLPDELRSLAKLKRLYFNNTEICEPSDSIFQTWLSDTVPDVSGTVQSCSFCNNVTGISTAECLALEAIYNSTDGAHWNTANGWFSTSTPCENWEGVACEGGHITQLALPNNNLSGLLPDEIENLEALEQLDLSENHLTGAVSPSIIRLVYLKDLDLSRNEFSGAIPPSLGYRTNLETLMLNHNQFSGPLPSELGFLDKLTSLNLGHNNLSGVIPGELSKLALLQNLYIDGNVQLQGSLPLSFSNLTALQKLNFVETTVCEPQKDTFQDWFGGVTEVQGTGTACDVHNVSITASAGAGGTLSVSGMIFVPFGGEQTLAIAPDAGYTIDEIFVNGVLAKEQVQIDELSGIQQASLFFDNIQADMTVHVSFTQAFDYFLFEEYGGSWHDVNKDAIKGNRDDEFCWAAVASNVVEWGGWDTPLFDAAIVIFDDYQNSWSEGGGLMNYAWNWWLNGIPKNLPGGEGWSQPVQDGSGNYWSDYRFVEWYADSAYGYNAINYIVEFLKKGYGIGITAYDGEQYHHAMTAWGYQYDPDGNITGLWVTDSSDFIAYPEPTLHLLQLEFKPQNKFWYFRGGHYDGWNLTGAVALKHRAADGLVAHWKFDAISGDTAVDSSKNSHDGTIYGAAQVPGIDGNALHFFQGARDRVHAPGNFSEYVSDRFTVSFWGKVSNPKTINTLFHASDDQPGIFLNADNEVKFAFKRNHEAEPLPGEDNNFNSTPLPVDTWFHIACTWDGSVYKGFINGTPVGQKELPFFELGGRVYIGQSDGGPERSFDGAIDDVRIYNRALSPEEIRNLGAKTGLIAYWNFDEPSGNVALDVTNNGHDGIIHNYSGTSWERTNGISGNALNLTDGENYVAVPDDGSLSLTGPMTVEVWVKFSEAIFSPLVYKTSAADTNHDNYSLTADLKDTDFSFAFMREDAADDTELEARSTTQPTPDGWYHVAGVHDGEQMHIYVNGVLEESVSVGGATPYSGPADLVLGTTFFSTHQGQSRGWANVVLDEVRLYNRALSADEIRGHATVFHPIVATSSSRGSIVPQGPVKVQAGNPQSFIMTPEPGYQILELLVDGANVLDEPVSGPYEYIFDSVSAGHTIEARFIPNSAIVTISTVAKGNGRLEPVGNVTVEKGSDATIFLNPDVGYRIANIIVDGRHTGPAKSYTFQNITEDHQLIGQFVGRAERLAIVIKKCVERDGATGLETEIACDETLNGKVIQDEQVVCDDDCNMFVGTFSPEKALIFDSQASENSQIVRWETVYGTWLEDGIYFTEEDAVVNPIIGRAYGNSHGGNSHGGNSHGGNSHGGNSHGGNSHGGNSHGGNSHGGNSHGEDIHGGNSHGGNSHGGNSHGGNSHGGNSHGGNSHGGNSHGG